MDEEKNNKENQQNIDLSNVLDNLEKKSADEREEQERIFSPGAAKMVKLLFKISGGKIKSEKMANYILLAIAIIIFIISFFVFYSQVAPKNNPLPVNPTQQNPILPLRQTL
jgi:RsiW-degrading membrane proteinase PrsW (M82 family)